MTTFLAIILGTSCAGGLGLLVDRSRPLVDSAPRLWIGSSVCICLAVAGTLASLWIRKSSAADPGLRFRWSHLFMDRPTRRSLASDPPLWQALLATCLFWLVGGIAMQAVNLLGLRQLRVNELQTSILVAVIGLGIAAGSVMAGRWSRGRADFRLVRAGSWSMVVCCFLMAVSWPNGQHVLGYSGSLVVLFALGAATGIFIIPLQVFLQSRPSAERKGRIIAVMNQWNFVAILLSGIVYAVASSVLLTNNLPPSGMFALMGGLMLIVACCYRPDTQRILADANVSAAAGE